MTSAGTMPAPVTELFYHPAARPRVLPLAERFRLHQRDAPPTDREGFFLWAADDHLELRRSAEARGAWVGLLELERRRAQGGDLLRACRGRGGAPRVLDAMAGWGVDGLVLASTCGAVTLVERQPTLWALQSDLVRRSGTERVSCHCGDGFVALSEGPAFDVVYLDPMFPARNKDALPGKRMQWTAELVAPDPRPLALWLETAIGRALERVVLKRRRKDPPVAEPDWQIKGTTVRYDVYRGRGGVTRRSVPGARRTGNPDR